MENSFEKTTSILVRQASSFLTLQQQQLLNYVIDSHGSQVRKYTNLPYISHIINVAKILYDFDYHNLIEIALCHDLLEDTNVVVKELRDKLYDIGYRGKKMTFIINGVVALTDVFVKEKFPDLNRSYRKLLETSRLSIIEKDYMIAKLADLIDNSIDISANDENFAKVYIKEKEQILQAFVDRRPELRLYPIYQKARKLIL